MFRSLRSLIVLLQALSLLSPLLSKGRKMRLPFLFKELALLMLTNSDLVWKFLEKRRFTPDAIREFLKSRGGSKL
jgi:hypothetical protein